MTGRSDRTPVIVGVGQLNDRPADASTGMNSAELMVAALKLADRDAGGGWLRDVQSLAVVDQMSWPQLNPVGNRVARAIGAAPAHIAQTASPSGDSPVLLLNEAANRIGCGEATICAVAGGEALRTAAQLAAAKAKTDPAEQNAMRRLTDAKVLGFRRRYGLSAPVDIYPLYENATRAAWGLSLAQAQEESGRIWSAMSEVAAANPDAWMDRALTPDEVIEAGTANRPIAFPYTKFQVANASVNQGAGFIVASLAEARARGVLDDRLVHIGMGAAAHEPDDFLARDSFDASTSMAASIARAMELNGLTVADLDHVELYSCFPCIPKMARRGARLARGSACDGVRRAHLRWRADR